VKRMLGLIICFGILFALSGCTAGASTSAMQPKAVNIGVMTRSPNPAKTESTISADSPLQTPPAKSAANLGARNSAEAAPPGAAPVANDQAPMAPGVLGTVLAVDGSAITVQDSRQQSNATVTLTDNTQIFKQATIAMTDVAVGESLTAMGSLNDDVFTAAQIRIGVEAAPADAAGGISRPNGGGQPGGNPPDGGQPPAGGQPPSGNHDQARPAGQPLFGTVTAVSSDALTVETTSGSTVQVQLAANGQMTRQVAGTSADIVAGVQIMARGEQSDATITATRIDIILR
jgi:hypothetical protein